VKQYLLAFGFVLFQLGCAKNPAVVVGQTEAGHEVGNGGDPSYIKVEHGRAYAGFLVERADRLRVPAATLSQVGQEQVDWFFSHQSEMVSILRSREKLELKWVDRFPSYCQTSTWACLHVGTNELYLLRTAFRDSFTHKDAAYTLIHEATHVLGKMDDTWANNMALIALSTWANMGHPESSHWSTIHSPAFAAERVNDDPLLMRNHYVDFDGQLRVWDERALHSYTPATNSWVTTPATENRFNWKRAKYNSGGGAHQGIWLSGYGIVFVPCYQAYESLAGVASAVKFSSADGKWLPVALREAPAPRTHTEVVKSIDRMIVWGGSSCSKVPTLFNDGGMYDPVADKWQPIAAGPDAPSPRRNHAVLWTGERLIVWGGYSIYKEPNQPGFAGAVADGGIWDPLTQTWEAILPEGAPEPRLQPQMVWTGRELFVFGGFPMHNGESLSAGGIYNPATKQWRKVPAPPVDVKHSTFRQSFAFWTGSQVVIVSEKAVLIFDVAEGVWIQNGRPLGPEFGSYARVFWSGFEAVLWNLESRVGSLLYP
jgi:hypothetical protein